MAGVNAALAEVAATRPHAELRQVVAHYLARLDPDGPEPDPTEGRSLTIAKHADGSVSGRFLDNSGLLCECHHTQVHHGYRIARDTDGRWHTHRPDGTEIHVLPRILDGPAEARAG